MNGQTDMSALHEQASICHYGRAITPFIFLTFWYFCFFVFVLLGLGQGRKRDRHTRVYVGKHRGYRDLEELSPKSLHR